MKAPEEMSTLYMDEVDGKNAYDYLIYIGRFQPFHNGHLHVTKTALSLSKRVILLCGSANSPRTIKNPFTASEKHEYVEAVLKENKIPKDRITVGSIADYSSNQEWVISVQNVVEVLTGSLHEKGLKIGIVGHVRDASSWYLKQFNWDFIEVNTYHEEDHPGQGVNSTYLRGSFFNSGLNIPDRKCLPRAMVNWMDNWRQVNHETYRHLQKEYFYIENYKKSWKDTPFPVQFITVDAVVIQKGHILLVQRRTYPGKDLWALPGGFLNENETLREGVIRELKEETKLKVSKNILSNHIKSQNSIAIDNPSRSLRGRTLTHVFIFNLEPDPVTGLSDVRAADDAKDTKWVPLNEFDKMSGKMFEDHYFIADHIIKQL